MLRLAAFCLVLASCATGQWVSKRAEKPATPAELAAYPVSVADPALRAAMERAGFVAVARPAYSFELELTMEGAVATLRSGGYFVDEVRGDAAAIAQALRVSERVAEFVRNSGTVEQRSDPDN